MKSLKIAVVQRYATSAMKLFLDFLFSRPAILIAVIGAAWHLSDRLSSIEGRLDVLEKHVEPLIGLPAKVEKNTELLVQIINRLDSLEQRVSGLERDVSEVKQRLGSLEVQVKAHTRLLDSLDKRVLQLNRELDNLRIRVSSLETKSARLGEQVEAYGEQVEAYGERLRRIERLLGEMKSLGKIASSD